MAKHNRTYKGHTAEEDCDYMDEQADDPYNDSLTAATEDAPADELTLYDEDNLAPRRRQTREQAADEQVADPDNGSLLAATEEASADGLSLYDEANLEPRRRQTRGTKNPLIQKTI
eukprot:gene16269-34066_t